MGAVFPTSDTKAEHLHTKMFFGTLLPNSWLKCSSHVLGGRGGGVCGRDKTESTLGSELSVFFPFVSTAVCLLHTKVE